MSDAVDGHGSVMVVNRVMRETKHTHVEISEFQKFEMRP